jgi:hypothetical protein
MTPYLIQHKVRGEHAFDVAVKMEMADGTEWWIIPTSGHRAYPYFSWPITTAPLPIPADWPDHYPAAAKRPSVNPTIPTLEDI